MPKPKVLQPSHAGVRPLHFDFGALDVPGQRLLNRFNQEGRKRLVGLGGIRGGKSWFGARWGLRQAFARGGLGWIIVPEYSYASEIVRLINQVLYQHWEVVADHHEHPFPRWRLKVGSGAEIEIRSAYDPDTIRAATVSWIWIDEGARVSELTYRNAEERVLSTRGPILLTTTPKGKNWVYSQLYVPFTKGDETIGVALLKTADNPHLPPEEITKLRERWADSQYAAQELDAEFVSFEGLCYQFDPEGDVIPRSAVPPRSKLNPVFGGIDWGYGDPLAIVVIGQADGVYYQLDEYYGTSTSLDELASVLRSLVDLYRPQRLWFSFERPEISRFLREKGLPVHSARKTDIGEGISLVDSLVRRDRYKVVQSCINTINEFGLYQYRTAARSGEKRAGEKPLDRWNHSMDAIRMAIVSESPMQRASVNVRDVQMPVWR